MPSKAPPLPGRNRRLSAVAALALALLLLVLGLPRLAGNLLALPASAVLWSLHEGGTEPPAAIRAAAGHLAMAALIDGDGFTDLESGYALLKLEDWEGAEAATLRGLARSPGNPSAWARLSYLRLRRGDRAGAGAALRLSLLSGAVAPGLMQDRLQLAYRLLPDLSSDTVALVQRQSRLVEQIFPPKP